MIEIALMDVVEGTSTNDAGCSLFYSLKPAFDSNTVVKLSMKGATPMSSSFMNSSFGELIDSYGVEKVKNLLRLSNVKPSQAEQIKTYLADISQFSK